MKNLYDVIVVGSGIGGLVCASYLSRHGLKVLVIEKNNEVGGYCTTFERRGYKIDTTIHAIQNCDPGNILNVVFGELGLSDDLLIVRSNPTDTVICGGKRIHISNNLEETIYNFQICFPEESQNIDSFFKLFKSEFMSIFRKYSNCTFAEVLNDYFDSEDLKSIFGIFLGNIGSFPSNTCAVSAIALLRQFILSGGFYVKGGMQTIPNSLANKIRMNGGQILLGSRVSQIVVENDKVAGVRIDSGEFYPCGHVVSNADLTYTFKELIKINNKSIDSLLASRVPSLSIFIVYLLLKKSYKEFDSGPGVWYLPEFEMFMSRCRMKDKVGIFPYRGLFCSISSKLDDTLMPPGKDIVRIMTSTRYHNSSVWRDNAKLAEDILIDQVSCILPDIISNAECVGRATSLTMRNYTYNREGAVAGWANSPEQVNDLLMKYIPDVRGLYFTGHWVPERYGNGGVAMVASSGRKVAKSILKSFGGILK